MSLSEKYGYPVDNPQQVEETPQNVSKMKQRKEYLAYKKYQDLNQYVLDLANTPEKLSDLPIEELLRLFSIVENMYFMRNKYRQKYFTPEEWDAGHQHFINTLLQTMDIYRDILKIRFKILLQDKLQKDKLEKDRQEKLELRRSKIIGKSKPLVSSGKEEVIETTEPQEQIMTLAKKIKDIDNNINIKIQQEAELWKSDIPKLIQERQNDIQRRKAIFTGIKQILSKIKPDITDEETILFIMYIITVTTKIPFKSDESDQQKSRLTVGSRSIYRNLYKRKQYASVDELIYNETYFRTAKMATYVMTTFGDFIKNYGFEEAEKLVDTVINKGMEMREVIHETDRLLLERRELRSQVNKILPKRK